MTPKRSSAPPAARHKQADPEAKRCHLVGAKIAVLPSTSNSKRSRIDMRPSSGSSTRLCSGDVPRSRAPNLKPAQHKLAD